MENSLNSKRVKSEKLKIDMVRGQIEEYTNLLKLQHVNVDELMEKIASGWCEDMTRKEIVDYCSETAASMITKHPEYGWISSRIIVSYIHDITMDSFVEKIKYIQKYQGTISEEMYKIIVENAEIIDSIIDYEKDFLFNYFGILTLMKSYLIKVGEEIVERPQDVFMRTALQVHKSDFGKVKETYEMLSRHYFTHATPTLYNSCLKEAQLASCFLITPREDSIEGVYHMINQTAIITKYSGGIGLNLHGIRSKGSPLKRTGGKSNGIIPLIQVLNATKRYINQGAERRPGSIAIYLEPWHMEIFDFLDLRKNTGPEEFRARDIFIALWINDLFMERVKNNEEWSLFCPSQAVGLNETWGEEFNALYCKYEKTISRTVVPAQKLWKAIIEAQIETGTPYMCYKDACNRLSNQQHLGTIKSSNLCAEIVEYSSGEETSVCNLGSISLPMFVKNKKFDFESLKDVVRILTINLNKVIDFNYYPVEESKRSNMKHRPIGIGVQGLADLFAILRLPFDSDEARNLNKDIFETMYYSALETSCKLAEKEGPFESYEGSPISKGIFHFELAGKKASNNWDWEGLRERIKKYGTRNSLLIALMPTAGTSQIFGNNETFEPFISNIYTRRTHAGEFQIVNKHLINDLSELGLWSYEMKNLIIENEGSIQNITTIPKKIRDIYKTAWEIKMKAVIDLAADRQVFVDQSQSLNVFVAKPTYSQLTSMHFYGYHCGLKTGMYYLRTRPITSAIKFTVDKKLAEKTLSSMNDTDEPCSMCSS
ncbi:ribonucleoside diphosphate reductase [Encephalitozoon intestinalis ATCC 50506]|uniref:Ribonucleoside-diphosphate reductase n=1 Tax=Encephalitozoon intestinalis (strain ATCC 50506) TaxID=876142 RepID=E0S9M7_ENCIT|nr:ribonucleoside diphosphate reductase [Encephalitozoon intestinalis ATCC 50506]ADM12412.1 ribonucleoside diphosphate reductase [Encephalitozoon intestinalis ATCC 50506]UTX46246.1 ribonucleoside diphosphate reductase [Encephalitozoon intestinalis]